MSEAEIGEGETGDQKLALSFGNFHQLTQTVAASDSKEGTPQQHWNQGKSLLSTGQVLFSELSLPCPRYVVPAHQALIYPLGHPFFLSLG